MGGGMKGHTYSNSNSNSSVSNGSRGRSYGGLMVVLTFVFLSAIFGIMFLHKLRERHVLNLLVHQKDREILSLQHLLQKEKDHTKETKRKLEEMKVKIYSLRTQKTELNNRILEMQSTISSLKEEQRTMGSSLEERQNEIKLLREKEINYNKQKTQVLAISETLRQKEAEIEDLKHHFDLPVKVWSVSTDDPSNPPINSTYVAMRNKTEDREKSTKLHGEDLLEVKKAVEDGENMSNGITIEKQKKMKVRFAFSEKPRVSEFPLNRTLNGEGRKQKEDEVGHSEEQGSAIQQKEDKSDFDQVENGFKQGKVAEKYEEREDLEDEETHESETDSSRESSSKLDEDDE